MSTRRAWSVASAFVVVLACLSASLPADGFFSGDSGVKLIAARAAWDHPLRPFDLALPKIKGAPASQFLPPFVVQHEWHAHAVTSPLFPIASAPFVGVCGVRGAYVLPILSFGVIVICIGMLAERLRLASSTVAMILTAFCSPIVFYGLEYWEHLPAVAAASAGVSMLTGRPGGWKIASAGLLLSLAAVLRPEGVWFCLAAGIALMSALPTRSRVVLGTAFAAGMLPISVFNYRHFGNLSGLHVSTNLGALLIDWPGSRMLLVDRWFGPAGNWALGISLLLILVGVLHGTTWGSRIAGYCGLILLSVLVAMGRLPRENLWATAPSVALALIPVRPDETSKVVRAVEWATLLGILGVLFTVPNDGGAQWGPRYILFAVPPLLLVGAHKMCISWTHRDVEGFVARAAVVLTLLAAVVTTRSAYRELRTAKRYYSRLAHATLQASRDASFIVSNIWWFDQVNAGVSVRATFLYAKNAASANAALRQTSPAPVLLASSKEPEFSTALSAWTRGTCYKNKSSQELPEREVVLQRVECGVATSTVGRMYGRTAECGDVRLSGPRVFCDPTIRD